MTSSDSMCRDLVRQFLRYDAATGHLYWKVYKNQYAKINDRAGWYCPQGYRHVTINQKKYMEHHIVWLHVHGRLPEDEIDHINGVRDDNRVENLREVTRVGNGRNLSMRPDNTSGTVGVTWDARMNKWKAQIGVEGKNVNIGHYSDMPDAVHARKLAEKEYGFHKNHGLDSASKQRVSA